MIIINTGNNVADYFKSQKYKVQKYNSKSVWLEVDDRLKHLKLLQADLSTKWDCYHNPSATGSSIGALVLNGVKVYLKNENWADVMQCETMAIDALNVNLNNVIKDHKDFFIVLDNGTSLKNPKRVLKTTGLAKSDFYIENDAGEELHISHKNGSLPKHFQQWSGCANMEIANNAYCQQFQSEMQKSYKELKPRQAVAMKIPDDEMGTRLKVMAVYGHDSYDTSVKSGKNKVDCLIQGVPSLQQIKENTFKLASDVNHVYNFPQIPTGGYEPVLSLIYKGDRANMGIKGARASIYPIAGRPFKEFI